MRAYTHARTNTHPQTHMHMHTHTHTYTHAYTHTHTRTQTHITHTHTPHTHTHTLPMHSKPSRTCNTWHSKMCVSASPPPVLACTHTRPPSTISTISTISTKQHVHTHVYTHVHKLKPHSHTFCTHVGESPSLALSLGKRNGCEGLFRARSRSCS